MGSVATHKELASVLGREVVDGAYAVLMRECMCTIERVAHPDAKHGPRLRMENYAFLADALGPPARSVCLLAHFAAAAAASRDAALAAYVQQQLEYGKFWQLLHLSEVCLSEPSCLRSRSAPKNADAFCSRQLPSEHF